MPCWSIWSSSTGSWLNPLSLVQRCIRAALLSGQLYTITIEPFLRLLRKRMKELILREPDFQVVQLVCADDVFFTGDLAWMEDCQALYLLISSARVNWVKSSGLMVGNGWTLCNSATINNLLFNDL
ncbi:unnamed protein product [Caretta caretta]